MGYHLNVIILVVFLGVASTQENSQTYNFEMFLENSLQNYTSWLRENNLDPTPSFTSETVLFNSTDWLMDMVMKIRDDQMSGHSNECSELGMTAKLNMNKQLISLRLQNKGFIRFEGKYTVNGTVGFGGNLVTGDGTWTYDAHDGLYENVTYRFKINQNGHVEISGDSKEYNVRLSGQTRVEFEGVLKEELVNYDLDKLKELFADEYQKTRMVQPDHPTTNLIRQYLQTEIFQKTNFSEIIQDTTPSDRPEPDPSCSVTTLPPTTQGTTQLSSISTSSPPTEGNTGTRPTSPVTNPSDTSGTEITPTSSNPNPSVTPTSSSTSTITPSPQDNHTSHHAGNFYLIITCALLLLASIKK